VIVDGMASITREIHLDVDARAAWDALRDFRSPHTLFAGVLTGTEVNGDDRVVTFASGMRVRERLVDLDEQKRRLAYTVLDGPFTHHHATMSIETESGGGCRFVWTSDLLPHDVAPMVGDLMDQGVRALAVTLSSPLTEAATVRDA
jgi:hypothetical protein